MALAVRFDGAALIDALNAQRDAEGLTWTDLADALHAQSSELNERIGGDCLCQGALVRTAKRATMSCQYALILLRWVGRPPEDFLTGTPVEVGDTALPAAGTDRRLRFDLPALHSALNSYRTERHLTWRALADDIGCTPARLTNLRTARLADMDLTMRVAQTVGRPAADFVHATDW